MLLLHNLIIPVFHKKSCMWHTITSTHQQNSTQAYAYTMVLYAASVMSYVGERERVPVFGAYSAVFIFIIERRARLIAQRAD